MFSMGRVGEKPRRATTLTTYVHGVNLPDSIRD
jgi:hypothetical protein